MKIGRTEMIEVLSSWAYCTFFSLTSHMVKSILDYLKEAFAFLEHKQIFGLNKLPERASLKKHLVMFSLLLASQYWKKKTWITWVNWKHTLLKFWIRSLDSKALKSLETWVKFWTQNFELKILDSQSLKKDPFFWKKMLSAKIS